MGRCGVCGGANIVSAQFQLEVLEGAETRPEASEQAEKRDHGECSEADGRCGGCGAETGAGPCWVSCKHFEAAGAFRKSRRQN